MSEGCRQALEDLALYLDRECPANLEQTIRDHLDDCSPCMDRAEFERELRAVLARRCKDSAPSGLADRIVANLKAL